MPRFPLVIACACAMIATYSFGQTTTSTTPQEAAAALKAIREIADERIPKLQENQSQFYQLLKDSDKREHFSLIYFGLYRDIVETRTQIDIIDVIQNPSDKSNVTLVFAKLWDKRFDDFESQCKKLNELRLLSATSAAAEKDPLVDVIKEVGQVRKEVSQHIAKLKRIKAQ